MSSCEIHFVRCIDNCLVPILEEDFCEDNQHPEYNTRLMKLKESFPAIIKTLQHLQIEEGGNLVIFNLSLLYILYIELQTEGPWNSEECVIYASKLNASFEKFHGFALDKLLENSKINKQLVFDKCLENLHKKLTQDQYRRYPSLIAVYCIFVERAKVYNIAINVNKIIVLPLLLVGDLGIDNKLRALKCCNTIIGSASPKDFANNNFYEVIYDTILEVSKDQNLQILEASLQCLLQLVELIPNTSKENKTNTLFVNILDQLFMETNVSRKIALLEFMPKIIAANEVKCVGRKKKFFITINLCLDICTEEGMAQLLLPSVLKTLCSWIEYCWSAWKLSTDYDVLKKLLKLAHVAKNYQEVVDKMIATLVQLCTEDEQKLIVSQFKEANCEEMLDILKRLKLEDIVKV